MQGKIAGAFLLCAGMCTGLGQAPPPSDPGPVQAELLGNLDVRHLVTGNTFFARVTSDWNDQDCALRKGAVLQGSVELATPRQGKGESTLALSFHQAECTGSEMQPIRLVLAAVAQPPTDFSLVPDSQYWMAMNFTTRLSPSMGSSTNHKTPSGTPERFNPTSAFYQAHMDLGGVEHRFPFRPGLKSGDVLNIKGIKLDPGRGPDLSSILSAAKRDVFLAQYTQILLLPALLASNPSSAALASPVVVPREGQQPVSPPAVAAIAAVSTPFNDIEVCAPPGCAVDLPPGAKELIGQTASSIAADPLGYVPRRTRPQASLADEESLFWLGPTQLLFTFNPHQLIRRGSALNYSSTARVIRAVLLDTTTRNVIQAVDWEVTDSRRYIWPLEGNRVLVHVGNELRVYGSGLPGAGLEGGGLPTAGLKLERSIPLRGTLLFVRTAPNGDLSAVATLRERHTPELHAKLLSEVGMEPQEDVDIAVLNKDFETIAKASTVSDLVAPTLLNEGQVRLQAEPNQRYRLTMSTWEGKRVPLARFQSFCMPQVSSAAPDMLLLLTCNADPGSLQYRVLRADGKVLLRGVSNAQELGHEAMGNPGSGTFAVKIVRAERPILPAAAFTSADLDSEEVRVYRADTGKRLVVVRVNQPAASHGGYALSPDGTELAVLSGSEIQLFPVPTQ